MTNDHYFIDIKDQIIDNNTIPSDYYSQFDVKRGLRNKDGSGVLAGLSRISSVIGSQMVDYQKISVDGDLQIRDISIFDLCKDLDSNKFGYENIVFLLLVGRLPEASELTAFSDVMSQNRLVPTEIIDNVIKGLPSNNMMNKLQSVVAALYGFDVDPDNLDPYLNFCKAVNIIAKMPMAISYSYLSSYVDNPTFVKPESGMSHAESFLYMLRQGQAPTDLERDIFDLSLVLHAEHGGGNNSTFTNYVVSSSGTDIYSSIAASIASLKGPLHGSANKKVMDMMADIKENVSDWKNESECNDYLLKILKKEAHDRSGKIYGLGHAVYTKSDPRAIILKEKAKALAAQKGREDELQLYLNIEKNGPDLFNEFKGSDKVISPNVDFFSGFVYDCLGIPAEIYTAMFACARAAGWSAHRIEEILSGKRIIRPGYKFVE